MKKYIVLCIAMMAAAGCKDDEQQSPACSCSNTYDNYVDTTSVHSAIYIPNAFTPNSDGVNDVFYVYGAGLNQISIVITDGADTVFRSTNFLNGWDGSHNGTSITGCQSFDYEIDVTFANGQTKHFENTLTLITSPCPGNVPKCIFGSSYDATVYGYYPLLPSGDLGFCP